MEYSLWTEFDYRLDDCERLGDLCRDAFVSAVLPLFDCIQPRSPHPPEGASLEEVRRSEELSCSHWFKDSIRLLFCKPPYQFVS